jgi:hypothetical protein
MFHKKYQTYYPGLIVITGIWQFTESIGNGIFFTIDCNSDFPLFK